MEKKKISFIDLVNVLSQQEMKKVTGGCGGNNGYVFYCIHDTINGLFETGCFMSLSTALDYCDIINLFGYGCRCYSCD